ncbi:MAG TPA: MFS transporter [Candidatus Saccharimonadales bacterium]|nr:MFS transporter [Candidatus Saccharimonadales bacterium]
MKNKKWLILALLAIAQFMVVLDSAIVNVALPALEKALHFDQASLQWVVTGYTLTFGGFLLLGGRAADLYGRRRVLLTGIAGFTLFSLLIGLSDSSVIVVILRALQGLSAAMMSPAALSILLTTFKEGKERNTALGVWSAVGAGGAAVGVLLGGILTQYMGWEWNFFINIPVGILVFIGLLKYVPAHVKEENDKNLDVVGAFLVTGGLMSLVYAFVEAPTWGWTDGRTLGLFAASAVLLASFLFNESKVKHPLMPLSIFKIRNVSGANLMMVPVTAGMMGMFFFASLYIQGILQYSPVETGLAFLPVPIVIAISATVASRFVGKIGFKPLLMLGSSLLTIGIFYLSFITLDGTYIANVLPGLLIMGLGGGMTFVSISVAATSGVPGHEAGLASGLVSTSQQMGGALGLAILSGVATSAITSAMTNGTATSLTAASVTGYDAAFRAAAIFTLFALLVAIFVIRQQKNASPKTSPEAVSLH